MPIQVFQAQGGLSRPASNVSNVRVDNSGAVALAKANAGLGNAVLEGANKLHQAMVTSDIMEANNKYNLEMNKLQGKLFENKEANARNNMTQYEEGRQKILDDIFKNGPSSMRDPIVRQAFMQTADKDWVTQSMRMQNYMMGEEQKHQDTVLLNGYQDCLQNISTAYNNSQLLESYVDKGIGFTRAKFANYGEDKIKLEENKWKAQAYGNAINAALSADQYETAGALLQANGKYLDPKLRASWDKLINERRNSDSMIGEIDGLFAAHGKDKEGAFNAYESRRNSSNGDRIIAEAKKMEGQQLGVNNCANFASNMIKAAGGDISLNSSLADGLYLNYENAGRTFTDRNILKPGDLVFWEVEGSGYTASDDKAAVNSNNQAYKGITHCGIYMGNGNVMQSGTHGVSQMDIDTAGYKFVGAAHTKAGAWSNTEREQQRKKFDALYDSRINQMKAQQNQLVENVGDQLLAMSRDGQYHTAKEYEDVIYSVTGNNSTMFTKLQPLAAHFAKGGGYHELSIPEMYALDKKISAGNYDQEQLAKDLIKMNIKPSVAKGYMDQNKTALSKAAKPDKRDWAGIEKAFYKLIGSKSDTNDLEVFYAKKLAQRHIEFEKQMHNKDVSDTEVIAYMRNVILKGETDIANNGGYGNYRAVDLASRDIYRVEDSGAVNKNGERILAVWEFGSDRPKGITVENFENHMKGALLKK